MAQRCEGGLEFSRRLSRFGLQAGTLSRVYVVPHAGAGASAVRKFALSVDRRLDVVGIRLAGRESRIDEAPASRREDMVADALGVIVNDLTDNPVQNFSVIGQCAGAYVAFDVTVALSAAGFRVKQLIVLSQRVGSGGLEAGELRRDVDGVMAALPAALQSDDEFLRLLARVVTCDAAAAVGFPDGKTTEVPLTAVRGLRDPWISGMDAASWRSLTTGCFQHVDVDGEHNLLSTPNAFIDIVLSGTEEATGGPL